MKQKLKILVFSSIVILFNSCLDRTDNEMATYSNELFSIRYPSEMVIKDYSLTPFKGFQILDGVDTLFYSIGYVVSNLSEPMAEVFYIPDLNELDLDSNFMSDRVFFTARKNFDIDRYRKQNVFFDSESKNRKYTFPIDTTRGGMIGLYIDSIFWDGEEIAQFNAFVNNPLPGKNRTIFEALKTIRLQLKSDSFYRGSRYVW